MSWQWWVAATLAAFAFFSLATFAAGIAFIIMRVRHLERIEAEETAWVEETLEEIRSL